VLHIVTDTDRRGAQSAAAALHEELVERGWPSRIVALAPGTVGGLEIPALGMAARDPATLRALRRAARDADFVVAHGSSTLLACAVALVGITPFVYVNIGDPRAWLTSHSRLARTRIGLRRATAVAAISPQSAQVLIEWVGVPAAKVRVIRNFRDPSLFRPATPRERLEARSDLGLDPDSPLVVWMGSLTPEKRPDLALAVARALPGVQVVLAGGGPLADSLADQAQHSGARLIGPVSRPDRLLSAADVVMLTSDTEGVPGVLIEAGLCGKPTAATDVGFVKDVIQDRVTGVVVPAGDADALADGVRSCLENAEGWGLAALQHCLAHFTPEVVLPEWETLLREVTESR
jgi:glycosyltransferase involved in cell wall biosynthesis